ncbi:MAG TPA: class I SAM-dependent methyltransferase [Chthoniobacter sp.]|jgi:predicted O-methyltransferase YrrM
MIENNGQLNAEERRIVTSAVREASTKPKVVLEVGTWLGGGSTLHFLRALEANGEGHLWGIEADRGIYDQMIANIRDSAPEAAHRFTPLFGRSQDVIPQWLTEQGPKTSIDVAFLDGGDNPLEQITEFRLIADRIPVGGQLLAHDANFRKGKWLRPYLQQLDNWRVEIHNVSEEGLLSATKLAPAPSETSQRSAAALLRKLRLNPVECIGSILPRSLCGFLLDLMPEKLRLRVSQGR